MKLNIVPLFVFSLVISICCAVANQNFTEPTLDVSVDIPANMDWAEVQLNETSIDFGMLNTGNETHYRKVEIASRSNVNITITPVLQNGSDDIFSNLMFTRRSPSTSSNYEAIGNWSIDMNRTYSVGDWNNDYFYMKLNLKNYNSPLFFDITDRRNSVIFEIMPRYD